MASHILIRKQELHPHVRDQVEEVLRLREKRHLARGRVQRNDMETWKGIALGASAGGTVAVGAIATGHEANPFLIALPIGGAIFGSAYGPLFAEIGAYKRGSDKVREQTDKVGRIAKLAGHYDQANRHDFSKLQKTHSLGIIDEYGNIHLISNNTVRAAYAKARRTFLKEVLPGRWPMKLNKK